MCGGAGSAVVPGLLVVLLGLGAHLPAATAQLAHVTPDRYCLACLCVASSDCDLATGCRSVGGRDFCGPFYLTRHFWVDSNVTALSQFADLDYRECASSVECAGRAVSRYLAKHATDCDADGRITCKDFGLMHLLGYRECRERRLRRDAEDTRFVRRFVRCLVDTLALLQAGESVKPTCQPRSLGSLWDAVVAGHTNMALL